MAGGPFKVGLIIGTTRVVRIGPQVADFVLNILKPQVSGQSSHLDNSNTNGQVDSNSKSIPASLPLHATIAFDRIDLQDHNLPIFNEPGLPKHQTSVDNYIHEHTKTWSRRIASCDAFIFLSAQRNWGIPAELKNAIDYLFHEWAGKPAMLITYGGHGGEQCAAQLRTVLGAIGVNVLESMVNMRFPRDGGLAKALKGEPLGLDANDSQAMWAEHRDQVSQVFQQLVVEMEKTAVEKRKA